MTKRVEVFWSHQSPYCYFSLDRLLALKARGGVDLVLRPILPGVIRDLEAFRDRSEIEQRYFLTDVKRTADYLGIPYAEADPYPVAFVPGNLYRALPDQPRVFRLYHLTAAAIGMGAGWVFLDRVSRLIWDGSTRNWDDEETMRGAVQAAGLDFDLLAGRAEERAEEYERDFAENRKAMLDCGHWGAPTFAYKGEPFYGQDRFDQLVWRMDQDTDP